VNHLLLDLQIAPIDKYGIPISYYFPGYNEFESQPTYAVYAGAYFSLSSRAGCQRVQPGARGRKTKTDE